MSMFDKPSISDKLKISAGKIAVIIAAVLLCIVTLYVFFASPRLFKKQFPNQAPYDAIVTINKQNINIIQVADTSAEQTQGLSNHPPILENEGMLFEFKDKQVRQFWMKEMLFPLDIIWINDSRIINISKNLPPEGLNPSKIYSSLTPADMVLEINAGISDKYGFKIGDQISIGLPL